MSAKNNSIYELDGRVVLSQAVPFGLQHVLAMFVSNVTPVIILANACGLEEGLTSALIQNAMVLAGIGTLIQLYPVWRIGSRLPIVMGISFTFLSLSLSIATSQGLGTLMGAVIIGGIVEGLLGLFARFWIHIITPVVAATVVIAIGFSLLSIGAESFGGGQGAVDFGSLRNWIVGSFTLLVCLLFQIFGKGFLKSLSCLMGLLAGYVLALILGMVDFSHLSSDGIVALPRLMPFTPEFHLGAILSVVAIFLVSATETIGDTTAISSSALMRPVKPRELSGSIACDGFVSCLAGLLGCTPITSFSQNVGLAAMSKVVNRFTIATGAGIMILGGLFPVVGAVLTTIPQAVLGGCTLMMFGSILFAGFRMLSQCGFSERHMIIVSLSLSVGLGFTQVPELFALFPSIIRSVFAGNCVAIVFLLAVLLSAILPGREESSRL